MMATRSLTWGILGCARITRRGLIPGIAASTSGSLVALASRDVATARAWAEEFGIPKAYGSYQELLDDPTVQAIYVPFPNELHKPWVLAAADAGKQVLCEKSLALDAGEADTLVQHCRKRGVRGAWRLGRSDSGAHVSTWTNSMRLCLSSFSSTEIRES